jgi:hypothetical protein
MRGGLAGSVIGITGTVDAGHSAGGRPGVGWIQAMDDDAGNEGGPQCSTPISTRCMPASGSTITGRKRRRPRSRERPARRDRAWMFTSWHDSASGSGDHGSARRQPFCHGAMSRRRVTDLPLPMTRPGMTSAPGPPRPVVPHSPLWSWRRSHCGSNKTTMDRNGPFPAACGRRPFPVRGRGDEIPQPVVVAGAVALRCDATAFTGKTSLR